jgi:hypothetical protein
VNQGKVNKQCSQAFCYFQLKKWISFDPCFIYKACIIQPTIHYFLVKGKKRFANGNNVKA